MATQSVTQQQTQAMQLERGRRLHRLRTMGAKEWLVEILKYIALLVLTLTFLMPFYWMLSSAVKSDAQVYTVPPVWFPVPQHWNNFWDAWTAENYWLFTYNTVVLYAIPATIGTVLSSCLVAYSFSRLRWIGRDTLFAIVLATLMIPGWVRLVPLFIIFKKIGWLNTFLPLVVPHFFGNAFFIFLLRQFFMSIPSELSDAAKIDGANELQTMFRIILPLSVPALAVVSLFTFMDSWNDYLGPLIYVNIEEKWVLALAVQRLRNSVYLMAVSSIITLPIFLAFFFAQRTFIEGISVTGLKG